MGGGGRGSDFDWMVSNHAVSGWKAPVKASVSGVPLLSLPPFFASLPPLFPSGTPDTQATNDEKTALREIPFSRMLPRNKNAP